MALSTDEKLNDLRTVITQYRLLVAEQKAFISELKQELLHKDKQILLMKDS